jgi:putative membrane protein
LGITTTRMSSDSAQHFAANRLLKILLAIYALVWVAAAIAPRDWATWALENILVIVVVGMLMFTHRRFAFTNVSYVLILVYLCLHAFGAHYGYAHTPLGEWFKTTLGLRRNPYDRLIHCAFGLLLVYPLRELLIRTGKVRHGTSNWLAVSLILAVSSSFEVIESVVAEIVSPGTGPAWLGAQGDEWDAQLDMAAALLGAFATLAVVSWRERRGRGLGAAAR